MPGESMVEPQSVYRAGQARAGGSGVLHYTEDCRYLARARTVLEKPLAALPWDHPRCSTCWPEDNGGEP